MTTGATNTAQAGLSLRHSASAPPNKAVKGAAGRPCRYKPTDVKRGNSEREATAILKLTALPTARRAADRSGSDMRRARTSHSSWTKWPCRARPGQAVTPCIKQHGADVQVTRTTATRTHRAIVGPD